MDAMTGKTNHDDFLQSELIEERKEFFRRAARQDFDKRDWKLVKTSDPYYRPGAFFGMLDILNGLTPKSRTDGTAWPIGTVFEKGGEFYTVSEQKLSRRELQAKGLLRPSKALCLVDSKGERNRQYSYKTENIVRSNNE